MLRAIATLLLTLTLTSCWWLDDDDPTDPPIDQGVVTEVSIVSGGYVTLHSLGDTVRIYALALNAEGREVPNAKVEFMSLTPEIVSVDDEGLVTALANGKGKVVAFVRQGSKVVAMSRVF